MSGNYAELIASSVTPSPSFSIVTSDSLTYNTMESFTLGTVLDDDQCIVWIAAAGGGDPGTPTGTVNGSPMIEVYSEGPATNYYRPTLTCLRYTLSSADSSTTCALTLPAQTESICYAILRGLNSTTPIDAVGTYVEGGAEPNPGAVTTTADGNYVFAHYGTQGSTDPHPTATNYTMLENQGSNDRGQSIQYREIASAGVEDPPAITATGSSNRSGHCMAVNLA